MVIQMPRWEWAILRGKRHPIVKYRDTAVICANTAEPIEMPFGLLARMGPRNPVLDELHIPMDTGYSTSEDFYFALYKCAHYY